MGRESRGVIRQHALSRVGYFSGIESVDLADPNLSELFPDSWDFVELCEDLENSYEVDLRPFFEVGQPEVGWSVWRRKNARDVTARELAEHIAKTVTGAE